MLNWSALFVPVIIGRGKKCFGDGAVVGLHRSRSAWEAMVVGTELYHAGIGVSRGCVESLACNCPYARKGDCCKHMAALFFALEKLGKDVMNDEDEALSMRLDALSSDEIEDLLQLAIDMNSTRCTALLLNRKARDGIPRFALEEFTLDDLPEDALTGRTPETQGDNPTMKLLGMEQTGSQAKWVWRSDDRQGMGQTPARQNHRAGG